MRLRGYAGGAVKIDLSNRKIETFTFTEEVLGKYLGGRGLIDYFMYGLEAGINAFSEDNPLVIATGPVTGTLVPTSGRFAMGCKSPLTQTVSVGYSGGHWAPELKYAGFDALVITGRSETPVYILIRDQQIEIKDAIHLWGKDVQATEKLIREENQCMFWGLDQRGKTWLISLPLWLIAIIQWVAVAKEP